MKMLTSMFGGLLLFVATAAWAGVNVNTADAEQLQSLDGIGEVKAQAIVAYRKENGHFESKGDLTAVDGIGPATLDAIQGDIVVGTD